MRGSGAMMGSIRGSRTCVVQSVYHAAPDPSRTGRLGTLKNSRHSACPERWRSGWSQMATSHENDAMQLVGYRTGDRITPFRVKKI